MTENTKTAKVKFHPWWVVLLEGVVLVILGILFLTNPGTTMKDMVVLLGIYWTVDGITILASLIKDRSHWGSKLAIGIIDISSIVFITQPLKWTVEFPALVIGLLGLGLIVAGGIKVYHAIKGAGWGVALLGFVAILIGIPLVSHPFIGDVLAFSPTLGIGVIIGGIAAIIMAFKEKSSQPGSTSSAPPPTMSQRSGKI